MLSHRDVSIRYCGTAFTRKILIIHLSAQLKKFKNIVGVKVSAKIKGKHIAAENCKSFVVILV